MVTTTALLFILTAAALYALLSRVIEMSVVTLPMIFTAFGFLLGRAGFDLLPMEIGNDAIHLVAEVTLILVLFSDASGIKWRSLRGSASIAARMLLIGMPLTILAGSLVAKWVSPDMPWALAFLVAAILTPTDAALGQSVVTSPAVPERISEGLNVESGLNDGLALPVVLVAAILAAHIAGVEADGAPQNIALFSALQVTLGPLFGVAVGYGAAKLLDAAVARNTATLIAQGMYFLCVAFIAYLGAEVIGGNGFIAAFVGGLTFGNILRAPSSFIREFMEGEGQILTLLTFLIFGAVLAPVGLEHANWKTVVLAVAFLTLVRMGPIWLSLTGSGLGAYDKLFLGWFGPRGLASILFALIVLERFPVPGAEEIAACVVLTVLLSIVLHGVTANPMSQRFRQR